MHSPGVRSRLAVVRSVQIGRLALEVVEAEQTLTCGLDRLASVNDPAYLLVIPLEAPLRFTQGGRSGIVDPDEYLLLSQKAFYQLSSEPGHELLLLRLPVADLRGRLASVDDHVSRRFAPNPHMSRLLVDLIRGVAAIFKDGAPPNPEALATEIVSFVVLTLGVEDRGAVIDVRNGRYHLRRRIFDFIDTNLGDQDLSPKKIAASSHISLSYLYSLFNDDATTVGQFIQSKRLQRAYEILVADARGHRTVSEIAYEVGFKNVSHFSRSFSRHFSIAPRDVRHISQPADGPRPACIPLSANSMGRPQSLGAWHGKERAEL